MRSVCGIPYITRAGKWRNGIARYAMLQRVYNVMKVCNIIVTSAPVFRTRGDRGFLGKRNLGRIITCEISPNVRFQTRIIRTCIIATSTSVSLPLSLSLPHHCVKRDDRVKEGRVERGFISYKLFRRRPTYLPYVRMYCKRATQAVGLCNLPHETPRSNIRATAYATFHPGL